ncbi:MAG TPA: O-antigen ligase family protein [Candidatus Sulfomarinibacteraceae bacterium]|nr:O-antigen ligase family protein [Candidatus Sulfomarinibacteraceae bacterium]
MLNTLPLLVVLGWFAARRRQEWLWGHRVVTWPLAALTVWGLLRTDWANLRLAFIYVGAFALAWFVYLYVLNEAPSLALALVAVLVVQGVVATGQFVLQRDLGLNFMGELPLNPLFEGVTVLDARGQPWLRAYGLTAHPNLLGAMVAALLLLLLPYLSGAAGARRALLSVGAAAGLLALFFSFSRAAWLGLAVGLTVWLWLLRRPLKRGTWTWRRVARYILPLLILVLLLLTYQDLVLSRFIDLDRPVEARSIQQRLADAERALQLFVQQPLLGAGLGYFIDAASVFDADASRVHNVPLLVAAELGAIGLLVVLALLIGPFLHLFYRRRRRKQPEDRAWRVSQAQWLGPWLLMVVVNQLDTTLWLTGNWQTAILFGLIAAGAARALEPCVERESLREEVET